MSYTPRHYGWPWSPDGNPLPDEGTVAELEPKQQASAAAVAHRACSICGEPVVGGYCRCL